MYKIIECLIPNLPRKPYRNGVGAYEGVVAHATVSYAPDEKQLTYFQNNWKKIGAFAHIFVDWDSIRKFAEPNYIAWHAGWVANSRYVGVELCQTRDKKQFAESYKRYVWVIAHILKSKRWGVIDGKTLMSHDWVSHNLGGTTHSDPIAYLASHGKTWAMFVADVTEAYKTA